MTEMETKTITLSADQAATVRKLVAEGRSLAMHLEAKKRDLELMLDRVIKEADGFNGRAELSDDGTQLTLSRPKKPGNMLQRVVSLFDSNGNPLR